MTSLGTFCCAHAPELPDKAQHPHICLLPRDHVNDGTAHACPRPCGHTWVDIPREDAALLAALADQINELRLAGLAIENVSVMLSDPLGWGFNENKRRFRIEGDLVHADAEEPR